MRDRDATEGMDVKDFNKVRDVRAKIRAFLVDKWQSRVIQSLRKNRMGSHQVGA